MKEERAEKPMRAEDYDRKPERKRLRFPIALLIGIVLAVLTAVLRGAFAEGISRAERMRIASDSCLFPGVMLAGVGMLVFLSGEGAFDMLGYAVKLGITLLFRTEHESYLEYKARKSERKPVCGFLLLAGLVLLAAAGLFTGFFYAFS